MKKIENALSELKSNLSSIGTCGDGFCIIERPAGQHTNGGCRCSANQWRMQKYAYYMDRFVRSVKEAIEFGS